MNITPVLGVGLVVVIADWLTTGGLGWPELRRRRPSVPGASTGTTTFAPTLTARWARGEPAGQFARAGCPAKCDRSGGREPAQHAQQRGGQEQGTAPPNPRPLGLGGMGYGKGAADVRRPRGREDPAQGAWGTASLLACYPAGGRCGARPGRGNGWADRGAVGLCLFVCDPVPKVVYFTHYTV